MLTKNFFKGISFDVDLLSNVAPTNIASEFVIGFIIFNFFKICCVCCEFFRGNFKKTRFKFFLQIEIGRIKWIESMIAISMIFSIFFWQTLIGYFERYNVCFILIWFGFSWNFRLKIEIFWYEYKNIEKIWKKWQWKIWKLRNRFNSWLKIMKLSNRSINFRVISKIC